MVQETDHLKATGTLGRLVVDELVSQGFTVTALTRDSSKVKFSPGVTFKQVDFSSTQSLKEVFNRQDAVVSAIGTLGITAQLDIVEVACPSGIKRFIPSEFGIDTRRVGDSKLAKMVAAKVTVEKKLKELAADNSEFTWTALSTALFFDFVRSPSV